MDYKKALLDKIEKFIDKKYTIKEFWKDYNFFYSEIPEDGLNEYDYTFFSELNERLHHTDWEPSKEPTLINSSELEQWIEKNLSLYLGGDWKPED